MMRKFHSLLILIVFLSCASNDRKSDTLLQNKDLISIDLKDIPLEETIFLSDFFSKVTLIPLETNENSLIGHFSGMQIYNDLFFVLDKNMAKAFLVFDKEGSFIRKIGNIGNGPQEYIAIADFTIDRKNNHLLTIDPESKKIYIYSIENGNHLKSITLHEQDVYIHDIVLIDERIIGNVISYDNKKRPRYLLREINVNKGKLIQESLNVASLNCDWSELVFKDECYFYDKSGVSPKYTNFFMNTVYEINENEIVPYLTLKTPNWVTCHNIHKITENISSEMNVYESVRDREFDFNISEYIESDSLIFLEFQKGNNWIHVIYDKKTKKVRYGNWLFDDLIFESLKIPCLIKIQGDQRGIYTIVPPESIPMFLELLSTNSLKATSAKLLNQMKLSDETNPIILYYEK